MRGPQVPGVARTGWCVLTPQPEPRGRNEGGREPGGERPPRCAVSSGDAGGSPAPVPGAGLRRERRSGRRSRGGAARAAAHPAGGRRTRSERGARRAEPCKQVSVALAPRPETRSSAPAGLLARPAPAGRQQPGSPDRAARRPPPRPAAPRGGRGLSAAAGRRRGVAARAASRVSPSPLRTEERAGCPHPWEGLPVPRAASRFPSLSPGEDPPPRGRIGLNLAEARKWLRSEEQPAPRPPPRVLPGRSARGPAGRSLGAAGGPGVRRGEGAGARRARGRPGSPTRPAGARRPGTPRAGSD